MMMRILWLVLSITAMVSIWAGCGPNLEEAQRPLQASATDTLEGVIEVSVADDFVNHKHWYVFHLHEAKTGRVVQLELAPGQTMLQINNQQHRFSTLPRDLYTGQYVRLQGSFLSQATQASPQAPLQAKTSPYPRFQVGQLKLNLATQIEAALQQVAPTLSGVFGSPIKPPSFNPITPILNTGAPIQRTAVVIIVNLKDKNAFTTDKKRLEDLVFVKNNDVYDKATYGMIQFLPDADGDKKADIFGPFTVNDTSASNCRSNYKKWESEARTLATKQGVDFTKYNHSIFIIPNLGSCGFAGIANVGSLSPTARSSTSIRSEGSQPRVVSHELGHNIGMRHSAIDPNNDGKWNTKSTGEEYGDHSCFMSVKLANLNAPHMIELGVFDRFPKNVVNAKAGTTKFKIYELLDDPTKVAGPQVVIFPNLALSRNYYLSFKKGQYYDKAANAKWKTGVSIHTHTFTRSGQTLWVKTLKDGEVLTDSNKIEIKQIKKDANNAFVEVEVKIPGPDPACKPVQPTFTMRATTPRSYGIGKNAFASFEVENKNPAICGNTIFALSVTLPGKYSVSSNRYLRQEFVLAPGAKRGLSVNVINDGISRDVTVTLSDAFPGVLKAQSLKFRVNVDPDLPTTPPNLTGKILSPTSVQLDWDPSTDKGSGLGTYRVYRQLEQTGNFVYVAGASATKTTATDTRVPTGTKIATYYVQASDKAGNLSQESNKVTLRFGSKTAPTPPLNLRAKKVGADGLLEWQVPLDQSVGIKEYNVYHKIGSNPFKKLATATKPTYTHKNLPAGTNSYYITATDANNKESKPSNTAMINTQDKTPPSTPTKLTAALINSDKDVELKWTASTDAGGILEYTIHRRVGTSGAFQEVGKSKNPTYNDTGVPYGELFYYVKAIDNNKNVSQQSNTASVEKKDTVAPSDPAQLNASLENDTDAKLTWKASTDNGIGLKEYVISRKLPGDTYKELTRTTKAEHLDQGLPKGKTSYKVKAVDRSGNESKDSNEASVDVTVEREPPPEPPAADAGANTEPGNTPDTPAGNDVAPGNDATPGNDTAPVTDTTPGADKGSNPSPGTKSTDQQSGNDNTTGSQPEGGPSSNDGCGCSVGQRNQNTPLPVSLVLLGLFFLVSRRRR